MGKLRIALALCAAGVMVSGCKLSKEESSLAKLHQEQVDKKKTPPPGSLTEQQMGIRYYPDADIFDSGIKDEGAHILHIALSTPDSVDKVREFYEKELGEKAMPNGTPGMYSVQKMKDGKHYAVSFTRANDDTTILIEVSTPLP